MSTASDSALTRIHDLYVAQLNLIGLLQQDLRDPNVRRSVRESIREFQSLLRGVDWRYMGGEDVLEALRSLPSEVEEKLKADLVTVKKARRK